MDENLFFKVFAAAHANDIAQNGAKEFAEELAEMAELNDREAEELEAICKKIEDDWNRYC